MTYLINALQYFLVIKYKQLSKTYYNVFEFHCFSLKFIVNVLLIERMLNNSQLFNIFAAKQTEIHKNPIK